MRSFRNSSPSIWFSDQNKFSCRLITAELSGLPRYIFLRTHSSLWKLSGWCTGFLIAPVVNQKCESLKKKCELRKKRDHWGQQWGEHVALALKMLQWQCFWQHVNIRWQLAGLRPAASVWAAGAGDLEFQRSNKDNKGFKFFFNYIEFCAPPHRSSIQLSCLATSDTVLNSDWVEPVIEVQTLQKIFGCKLWFLKKQIPVHKRGANVFFSPVFCSYAEVRSHFG